MTLSNAAAVLSLDCDTQRAAAQPEDCQAIRSQIGHLFRGRPEEPGREVVQIAPPGEPLVRRAGRREVDVLDARLIGDGAECADGMRKWLRLLGAHADPKHLDFRVEGGAVLEGPIEGRGQRLASSGFGFCFPSIGN